MIMGENEARAAMPSGVNDDFAKRKLDARLIARVTRHVYAARLVVQMGHPQLLACGIGAGHAACEEGACRRKAIELRGKVWMIVPHDAKANGRRDDAAIAT